MYEQEVERATEEPVNEDKKEKEKKEVKRYPRDILTITADNGFVFKVGCQVFVCEGDVEKAATDLKRYLSLDPNVVLEYTKSFKFQSMLHNSTHGDEAVLTGCPFGASPAFDFFNTNRKPDMAIYSANNGIVTLDFLKGTATVKQYANSVEDVSSVQSYCPAGDRGR